MSYHSIGKEEKKNVSILTRYPRAGMGAGGAGGRSLDRGHCTARREGRQPEAEQRRPRTARASRGAPAEAQTALLGAGVPGCRQDRAAREHKAAADTDEGAVMGPGGAFVESEVPESVWGVWSTWRTAGGSVERLGRGSPGDSRLGIP